MQLLGRCQSFPYALPKKKYLSVMNKYNKSKMFVTYLPRFRFGESHHKVRSFDVTMSVFTTMNVLQSINLISPKQTFAKGIPLFSSLCSEIRPGISNLDH